MDPLSTKGYGDQLIQLISLKNTLRYQQELLKKEIKNKNSNLCGDTQQSKSK